VGLSASIGLLISIRLGNSGKLMPAMTVATLCMMIFFLFLLGDIPLNYAVCGLATYGVLTLYFVNTTMALAKYIDSLQIRQVSSTTFYLIDPPPSYDHVVSADRNMDFHLVEPPPYPKNLPSPSDDCEAILKLLADPNLITWKPINRSDIAGNFEKFLISPDGVPVKRYSYNLLPIDTEDDIKNLIE